MADGMGVSDLIVMAVAAMLLLASVSHDVDGRS
jgi:hypothetical protein